MRAYIGVIIVFVCVLLLWHGNQVVASRDYDDVRSERVYAYVCEHINILKRNGGFVPSYMGRTNIQDMVCFPAEKDDVDEDIMANIRATLTSTLEAKRSFSLHY